MVKAIDDSYSRLIFPSLENELRGRHRKAQDSAMKCLKKTSVNDRPPIKDRVVLGRAAAGCKLRWWTLPERFWTPR